MILYAHLSTPPLYGHEAYHVFHGEKLVQRNCTGFCHNSYEILR